MPDHQETVGVELLTDPDRPEFACAACGSPKVELPDWTDPNRGEIAGGMDSGARDGYCRSCQEHGTLFWTWDLRDHDGAELAASVAAHAPAWRALIARNRWARVYRPDE